MASRLALKYGVVSEEDRLSNSSDSLLVTEPTTGSKARTKGSLYLITTSRTLGGRTRDACKLVADTIRREYYYDESAGIAIVLEKAIRAANRRLRNAREGSGLGPGSIGIAVAVVRGNELYVATCGDADAYLIRSARLLMPEHESGGGLPAAEALRVDVWRGDFSVGDSLVLAARNVVESVGTEELKNAVVTLHPQSAVEHLHHLFVAAGGDGSDAVLAIEATEQSLARAENRLVPVSPSEPLAGAPISSSPIPLADHISGAATAVQDRAVAAKGVVREGFSGAWNRVLDLLPRRRTSYRRIAPAAGKRESQRRAAIAVLAFIGIIAVLGVVLWYWNPLKVETPIEQVTQGEAALAAANDKVEQVFGPADVLNADPQEAQRLLRLALGDLDRAATAEVNPASIEELRGQVIDGLEDLYNTIEVAGTPLYAAPDGAPITALVSGPDEAAYVISGQSVVRIDPQTGASATIVNVGDGPGQGITAPRLLTRGGPDLLIVDERGALWRWRPSDTSGGGTLGQVRVAGDQVWDESVVDVETFVVNADQGLYRLYVPYPADGQILRYDPTADGSGFSVPTPYFLGEGEDVASFRQLLIDGDVYAVTSPNLIRYFNGRATGFALDDPPDNADLRPGHDYGLMATTGTRGVGQLFVWDKLHGRVLVYDKNDGTYVEQFFAAPGTAPFADLAGMYLIDRGQQFSPILVWARPEGVYQVALDDEQEPEPTPTPSPSPSQSARPSPTTQPSPTGPTPTPTERPRRTPRPTPVPSP